MRWRSSWRSARAYALASCSIAAGCQATADNESPGSRPSPEAATRAAVGTQDVSAPLSRHPKDGPLDEGAKRPELEAVGKTTPERLAKDRARDAGRKPQAIMDFFGISPGDRVVELMAGRGYYAELLAARVGPSGRVWAHNSPFVLDRFAREPLATRLDRLGLGHLEALESELDAPRLPEELDVVLIILFFHDTYWQEVDRKAMLAAVFDALQPGGVFGVIDHHAELGSRDRDVKRLHRVDRDMVLEEVLAAGFVLDGESDLLRNPGDDRGKNVFFVGETARDTTDRFVLRFVKPGG